MNKVDVIIVGSGAAGSLMAAKLAAAGKQVVILEAGPERKLSDLTSSAAHSRRLKWSGSHVEEDGNRPIGNVFNSGFGTGGSALHHYAVWPRLHEEDFSMKQLYGQGLDWPIDYNELRPWYDTIQTEVGVSGDAESEIWRPEGQDYPMDPVPVFGQGDAIARGFEKLGRQTSPLPLAINTEDYKGRNGCIWDGWCDAGCPIGALANPLVTYLPMALEKGAQLIHRTTVTRLHTDQSGQKATGVDYADKNGKTISLHADMVILAAFAVQTPRLLLLSKSDKHPNGLANSSGLVGKYIMTHSAGLIYGLFDDDTQCYMGVTGGQLLNQDNYDHKDKRDKGFGSYQWMIGQATKPNDLLGFGGTNPALMGADLTKFMQRAASGFATMTACVEDLPVAANHVSLSKEVDQFGTPLAHVTHNGHAQSIALWQDSLDDGRRVFEAAGATQVWTGPSGAMHIMGGTIMGDDGANSVTNSYGQTHDIDNLFIAGPGLFPTSGGVNPTFTVHALTLRASDYIIKNWGSLI